MYAKRSLHPGKAYGCKIMGDQLERKVSLTGMQPFLWNMHHKGWKIIHLERYNVLRQALSRHLVKLGEEYHRLNSDSSSFGVFHIDMQMLQKTIQKMNLKQRVTIEC